MTAKVFCAKVRVRYKRKKSGSKRAGSGKGKRMLTGIRSSYIYLKSLKTAPLNQKDERSFEFVCSDKNKPGRNAVGKAAGLSE